jgi:hypothetical protein
MTIYIMNNTTTKRNLALAAVFIAAILVIGTFAATTAITQSAYAYNKKDDRRDGKDGRNGNDNGNTITIQKCKQAATQSGFDNNQGQECENVICTHPGNNATCTQEGAVAVTPTPTPKPTTTTLEVRKVCLAFRIPPPQPPCSNPQPRFSIQITGNNPHPSTFIITGDSSQLVTLGPGTFTIVESATFTIFNPTFSGDCMQTAPGSTEATGTISVGQHLTCTITNTVTQD